MESTDEAEMLGCEHPEGIRISDTGGEKEEEFEE